MEFVSILRQLVRHRVLAACGIVPAAMIGIFIAFEVSINPPGITSRSQGTVSSSARVLVQADDNPTVDLDAKTSDGLGSRARLMGDLMATNPVRTDIARRLGIPSEALTVLAPSSYAVEVPVPIANEANLAALGVATPYRLLVGADGTIPIVSLKAAAPDAASSRQIVLAAADSLERLIADGGPRGLSILRLGAPRTEVAHASSKLPFGIAATMVLIGIWCIGVVVLTALRDRWRQMGKPAAGRAQVVSRAG